MREECCSIELWEITISWGGILGDSGAWADGVHTERDAACQSGKGTEGKDVGRKEYRVHFREGYCGEDGLFVRLGDGRDEALGVGADAEL